MPSQDIFQFVSLNIICINLITSGTVQGKDFFCGDALIIFVVQQFILVVHQIIVVQPGVQRKS